MIEDKYDKEREKARRIIEGKIQTKKGPLDFTVTIIYRTTTDGGEGALAVDVKPEGAMEKIGWFIKGIVNIVALQLSGHDTNKMMEEIIARKTAYIG